MVADPGRRGTADLRGAGHRLRALQPAGARLSHRGYLTGKIDEHTTFDSSDIRSRNPRFTPEAIKANQAVIDLLARIGAQKQATPAQIALAWLLARSPWIVPIPGSRKIERLEENIGAVQVNLTKGDLREIDSAISTITVVGDRY